MFLHTEHFCKAIRQPVRDAGGCARRRVQPLQKISDTLSTGRQTGGGGQEEAEAGHRTVLLTGRIYMPNNLPPRCSMKRYLLEGGGSLWRRSIRASDGSSVVAEEVTFSWFVCAKCWGGAAGLAGLP